MESDYTKWSPADYLAQYYSTLAVPEDEKGILQFVLNFLLEKKQKFSEMLEVGCGPTIHHILPFVPYVGRFYMADYLESNLQEIRKWVSNSPEAHNWTPYLSGVLALEGNTSKLALRKRERELRKKIAGLLTCDALETNPLGWTTEFPLVSSFYCLECLGRDKDQWRQAMQNVASLVASGGYIILSALRNADKYIVCGREFPTTHIDENEMWETLIVCGFRPETINIHVCPCEWADEGFSSIIVCSAQKEGAHI